MGAPVLISIIALLLNGTDYFLIGLIGTSTGPIFYLIFKWMYGGLAVDYPEQYPLNPKTRLCRGDIIRFGWYGIFAGGFAFLGHFALLWYEGEWGGYGIPARNPGNNRFTVLKI